ncbi:hypothetical protein HOD75_00285 [archaeon]|jgi:hypothetical protein|nr:hypothetical protein [archaeon]MBT4241314.1 hypothetical protein [archaeon]MBT4418135.1 hypothetical protein [archaeon]
MDEEREISVLVEGCYAHNPSSLLLVGLNFEVFDNITVLSQGFGDHFRRYLLYGHVEEFFNRNGSAISDKKEIDWMRRRTRKISARGFPLERMFQGFESLFDFQRSLITNDGRIYVEESYFEIKGDQYLDAVPNILKYSGKFLEGDIDETYFEDEEVSLFDNV